jgi:hypothetical protein
MIRRFPRLKFDLDMESFSPAHPLTEGPQCLSNSQRQEERMKERDTYKRFYLVRFNEANLDTLISIAANI